MNLKFIIRKTILSLLCLVFTLSITHAQEPSLMIYTSRNEHLVKDIFELYQQQTGVKIQYRTGDPGQLIQALLSSRENPPADILMTVDAGNLWFAQSQNLLMPVESEVLSHNIPNHLRDLDQSWFGLSIRARTLVYNTSKIEADQLSSYEDLANEKWKGRLCLRTSRKVYNQSLVAMLIHELGEEKAKEVVQGWVNNAVEIFSNDTSVLRAVAAGQCDIGIVNTYYFGRLLKDQPDLPLKLFWPNQHDSYGVHVNISGAGVVKNSQNQRAAIDFLEWLSSEKAQQKFAQINLEYAINPEVEQAQEVLSWGDFKQNTSFNLSLAGKLQRRAIKLMHEVNYN